MSLAPPIELSVPQARINDVGRVHARHKEREHAGNHWRRRSRPKKEGARLVRCFISVLECAVPERNSGLRANSSPVGERLIHALYVTVDCACKPV